MAEIALKTRRKFLASQVGRTEKVLVESRSKNGMYEGYTMNYTLVHLETDESNINKAVDVNITDSTDDFCIGRTVNWGIGDSLFWTIDI